jgi:hypothetical protein
MKKHAILVIGLFLLFISFASSAAQNGCDLL